MMINPLSLVGSIRSGTIGQAGAATGATGGAGVAADVRRAFDLNTAIVKAFHQMFTMTTKSS
jgi:hypothetical protein